MNRALRAAALGVLLLSPIALSACSSGQIAQTAQQNRDKTGPMGSLGPIELRQVQLTYPRDGFYRSGDDAGLEMSIVNTGTKPDSLISITGDAFSSVYQTGTGSQPVSSAAATTGAGGPATQTAGSSGTGSLNIQIPADTSVYLGRNAPHVYLSDLSKRLTSGQAVQLTLTFENAGTLTMNAVVAPATSPLPRTSTYNFTEPPGSPSPGAGGHD